MSRTAFGLGAAVLALGVVVLSGWVLELEGLLRLHSQLPAMQFNTALLVAVSGLGLLAGAASRARLQAVAGLAVLAVAVPTALQFAFGRSLGVDTLFWTPFVVNPVFAAGRMAPASAVAFVLIGGALVAALRPRPWSALTGAAACVVLGLSLFVLAEFTFGRGAVSPWGRFAGMAVHTAAALAAIGAGLLCLAWRDSPRRGGSPVWMPWTTAVGTLVITALLASTLTLRFPADAAALILAVTLGLGISLAGLVGGAMWLVQLTRERADAHAAVAAELAMSEVRHRAIFEQSAAAILEVSVTGEVLRVNARFSDLVGRSAAEIAGMPLADLTDPEDRALDRLNLERALRDQLPSDGWVKRYRRPDGSLVWAHVSGSLVRDPEGAPLYLVGVVTDITSRVLAEDRVRESETRFRSVAETAAAGIVMADDRSTIVFANRTVCDMFGHDEGSLVGQPLTLLMPEAYRARHLEGMSRFLSTGASTVFGRTVTLEGLRRDGRTFPLDLSLSTWEARGQRFFTGILSDVSERVQAQQALDRSRQRLLAYVEHTPGAVAMLDTDLRYVAVSRRWLEDYQIGQRDIIGQHHYDVFPEIRALPEWQAIHQRCLAGAIERSDEDHFVRTDGRDEWLAWEVRPWMDERDRIGGIIMLTEVITRRKLAERALVESEQRLRLALENASQGLWDWNVATGEVVLDERWWRILGHEPGELPSRLESWERTIHEDDRARVSDALARSLASDDVLYDVEYRTCRPDGQVAWINTRGRVQSRDADGRPLRMIGTIHDVTARRQTEEQIRTSLEEKEVLLREVHHRVKNNLAVMSSLFYLESTTTENPEALRVLEESRNRIKSMALVHELLYRSHSLAGIDFAEYATMLGRQVLGTLGRPGLPIRLETAVVPTSLSVEVAIPCGLLLNELLTNCVKHAFEGAPADTEPRVVLELGRDGERIVMAIRDNGVGMQGIDPQASQTLGLRLVRSLATQVDGTVAFESGVAGTCVRLTFG
jgi:PAS domain S-box-containing protein